MSEILEQAGRFGDFGGSYIPETLVLAVQELKEHYEAIRHDAVFQTELSEIFRNYVGRPTPLTLARRLTQHLGGAQIYLKREDLLHTGAHKINNAIGQMMLARRMGKNRIVAETGAGQHGVAAATAAALFGMECIVYMGEVDMERQAPNVLRMRMLGAQVVPAKTGSRTLKDAINEAMRDWITNVRSTHYLLGSVLGPHPYPMMIRDFHSVIGREAREQILEREGRLPTELVACVGGGSNAMGLFHAFREDKQVLMTGVEAGGDGVATGRHAARFADGRRGVFHGTMTYVLQSDEGQIRETHSISAGLDYQAVGPEHAHLYETKRARYVSATDAEALAAFQTLARLEGILPALESSHAVAYAIERAPQLSPKDVLLVNLSGRGDKDLASIEKHLRGNQS